MIKMLSNGLLSLISYMNTRNLALLIDFGKVINASIPFSLLIAPITAIGLVSILDKSISVFEYNLAQSFFGIVFFVTIISSN